MKLSLQEFETRLTEAKSTRQMNAVLEEYLLGFGINTFAFTYYSYYPSSLHKLKYDFCAESLLNWHEHYISEGYEDIDSTLQEAYQMTLPTMWDLHTQLKEAKTAREQKMREDSIEYGVEKGVSIPIHGPQEDFATMTLSQRKGQQCLENFAEIKYEMLAASYIFCHAIKQELLKTQRGEEKHFLTSREMQCLILLARQYSIEAMAKELKITERTVNYHIQRLNKKMGTTNKYQSVIKALQTGILQKQ